MELNGKNILFLGSSVTYGSAAGGISFVDLMAERCKSNCIKEAVSGTTLADINEGSYVSRLKRVDQTLHLDLFVCQLSTNDANLNVDFADIEKSIRFILTYVKTIFDCPIVFYTGTYFNNERYIAMINLLYRLQKEYDFYILDLFNDVQMQSIPEETYNRYMADRVHPTLDGYSLWWTPRFIEFCEDL